MRSEVLGAWGEALGKWSSAFGALSDKLHEADRVSQINTGLVAIDQAFSLYNRDLIQKKWDRPVGAGSDKAAIPFSQIDEWELEADHAAQVKTLEDYVNQTVTNKDARDYLTNIVKQKAVSNYQQVWDSWFTHHNIELVAQSDRNIATVMQGSDTTETKKAKIATQLASDTASGIRHADDAAAYRLKLEESVNTEWAYAEALEVAKKAGYNAEASDIWIDRNTPFWNGDPGKRQATKNVVRQEVEYQRNERQRINNEHDEQADMIITMGEFEALQANSSEALTTLLKSIPGEKLSDPARIRFWEDRIQRDLQYVNTPFDSAEAEKAVDKYQKAYAEDLDLRLADLIAKDYNPNELRKLVIEAGQKRYINGTQAKDRMGWLEEKFTKYTKEAIDYLNARVKEKKLSPVESQKINAQMMKWVFENPQATREDLDLAVDNLIQPAVNRTADNWYVQSIQKGAEVGRTTALSDKDLLDQLATRLYTKAKTENPEIELIGASPDMKNAYGFGAGHPYFVANDKRDYVYLVDDKGVMKLYRIDKVMDKKTGKQMIDPSTGNLVFTPFDYQGEKEKKAEADRKLREARAEIERKRQAEIERAQSAEEQRKRQAQFPRLF